MERMIVNCLFGMLGAYFMHSCMSDPSIDKTFYYEVTPVVINNSTYIDITLTFQSQRDSIPFGLPTDNYGTPNIYKYVKELDVKKGIVHYYDTSKSKGYIVPESSGAIEISYRIAYIQSEMEKSSFGPVVSPNYFSIAGCQWLLHIGDDAEKRLYNISLKDDKTDWRMHSSLGENIAKLRIAASYNDLISSRIGGGGAYRKLLVDGKPLYIILKGSFEVGEEKLFSAIERIVRLQRKWFNDYDLPFYNVVINERDGIIAGTAFDNQFVCFVSSKTSELDINIILAHEMFHNWLPNQIEIKRELGAKLTADDYNKKFEWFSEGFTTYFAKRLLLDEGLITPDQFIAIINNEIIELTDSPHRLTPYNQIQKEIDNRTFTSEHKQLSYWRGALIALIWEKELDKQGTDLSAYIRGLYDYAKIKEGVITEREFYEFSENFGIDAAQSYHRYIRDGQPIEISNWLPDKIADDYKIELVDFEPFAPGFDLMQSRIKKEIIGLQQSSTAYKAGLRNGMPLIRAVHGYRGEKGWSTARPLKITVMDNHVEREISFIPLEEIITIQRFSKRMN